MTGRCATCKWWQRDNAKTVYHHYGYINLTHGVCMIATEPHRATESKASVELRGQEGPAWLQTDEGFGCVQWEAKG